MIYGISGISRMEGGGPTRAFDGVFRGVLCEVGLCVLCNCDVLRGGGMPRAMLRMPGIYSVTGWIGERGPGILPILDPYRD